MKNYVLYVLNFFPEFKVRPLFFVRDIVIFFMGAKKFKLTHTQHIKHKCSGMLKVVSHLKILKL